MAPEPALWLVWTATLVLAAAASFYARGLEATGGLWPAPLDDVYIHFDFARSAALGHPFEWVPGNGYSSGATSLLYPLVLAPGWLAGLRGDRLGLFAAAVAVVSLVDLCRSLRLVAGPRARLASYLAAPLVLAVPLVDWSFFSGMESALLAAVLGRALLATHRACTASALDRSRAQLVAGLWLAALFATRPEMIALALPLGVAVAHGARSLGTVASLARSLGPVGALGVCQSLVHRALTSEWSPAGAVRKLVGSNPYTTSIDAALEVIRNLAVLRVQAFDAALGGAPFASIFPLLALVAIAAPRTRRLGLALAAGGLGALGLVSLNATAQFQNLRYAVPSLVMLIAAAFLGVAALARHGRPGGAIGAAAVALAIAGCFPRFSSQIDHFARASANIAGQQVEVGLRLAALSPRPRRVLVGDAGAIPYFSGLPALDGLGLGGYHDLPFARASVHGVPAVVELIERLDPGDRPDVLALYPSWWVGLADVFGRPIDAVKIADNVICAADEKVIYEADWAALATPGERRADALDTIDVADLVDERAHAYEAPSPRGGWVIGAVLAGADGAPRFDAGRIVPEGRDETFVVADGVARGPVTLVLRTDGGAGLTLEVSVEGAPPGASVVVPIEVPPRSGAAWSEVHVPLRDVAGGDRVRVRARRGGFRSFHTWLLRAPG